DKHVQNNQSDILLIQLLHYIKNFIIVSP
ncbi:hypothetical protein A5855_002495, partial [Enterococcus faecium]